MIFRVSRKLSKNLFTESMGHKSLIPCFYILGYYGSRDHDFCDPMLPRMKIVIRAWEWERGYRKGGYVFPETGMNEREALICSLFSLSSVKPASLLPLRPSMGTEKSTQHSSQEPVEWEATDCVEGACDWMDRVTSPSHNQLIGAGLGLTGPVWVWVGWIGVSVVALVVGVAPLAWQMNAGAQEHRVRAMTCNTDGDPVQNTVQRY